MTRTATCWHLLAPGEVCDAELYVEDGVYVCPLGHRLRQELSEFVASAIEFAQVLEPMHDRFFEGRGGGLK